MRAVFGVSDVAILYRIRHPGITYKKIILYQELIPIISVFGSKKCCAPNCAQDKLLSWTTPSSKNSLAFVKSSKMSYANCYLPLHPPDLSTIEHYWAWLKSKLPYLWRHVANFYDRLSFALNLNYWPMLT
jgi:hypothetical protein